MGTLMSKQNNAEQLALKSNSDHIMEAARQAAAAATTATANSAANSNDVMKHRSFSEKFLDSMETPFRIARDALHKKDYVLCEINCEGNSYRSPWSNIYEPPISNGYKPSKPFRQLEVDANVAFEQYAFYIGAMQSVVVRELDDGCAVVVFIKKKVDIRSRFYWEASHVFEILETTQLSKRTYILTTKLMLWSKNTASCGDGRKLKLVGRLLNQITFDDTLQQPMPNVNVLVRMVDEMEDLMRNTLNENISLQQN